MGEAATFMVEFWDLRLAWVSVIINRDNTNKLTHTIACSLYSQIYHMVVKTDVDLIAVYHKYCLTAYFNRVQKGDIQLGGKAGFFLDI